MILAARKQFPAWIKKAGYETEGTIITSRLAAIDNIIVKENFDFWIDVIKLYLGIRVSGTNINTFIEAFSTEDGTFPLTDNQNLLRHLASATLSIFVNETDFRVTYKVALSITTTTFLGQYDLTDFNHVLPYARLKTQLGAVEERNNDLDTAGNSLSELESNFEGTTDAAAVDFQNQEMNALLFVVRNILTANKALKEELNVHWWLFGEFMPSVDLVFNSIEVEQMTFLSAAELSTQTVFSLPLRNCKQYLQKAIRSSKTGNKVDKINIYNAIQKLSDEEKSPLLEKEYDGLNYQTPLLLALKCSCEVNGEDWSVYFKATSNQGDVKNEFSCVDIAEQLYRELSLVKYA
ncbi:GTPase-associated system all-helical protein GASH [Mucilaginibacter sp. 44-25]|uniref:GTPase-associated system all-helical protein GASH n=1 Tax=Mucilaginibacter sp. 44-25 TaxID=1895794 RepID=UPI0009690651|nr:GTPase-associated system all-helical protein GASH [Mucilaginibacter sp. 44-25]OJW12783.1 MAG: hypothetical protein BGO48_02560 [Mucilaginibacter sp. 44-25]